MKVDLTEDMIVAIQVAFAELQTGEWESYVNEKESQQVSDGEHELSKLITEHLKNK